MIHQTRIKNRKFVLNCNAFSPTMECTDHFYFERSTIDVDQLSDSVSNWYSKSHLINTFYSALFFFSLASFNSIIQICWHLNNNDSEKKHATKSYVWNDLVVMELVCRIRYKLTIFGAQLSYSIFRCCISDWRSSLRSWTLCSDTFIPNKVHFEKLLRHSHWFEINHLFCTRSRVENPLLQWVIFAHSWCGVFFFLFRLPLQLVCAHI